GGARGQVRRGTRSKKTPKPTAGISAAKTNRKEPITGKNSPDRGPQMVYEPVHFPTPAIAFAIEPKSRNDEDKLSQAIHKMLEEDLALKFDRDAQTKEFLLAGSGRTHIKVAVNKMKKGECVEEELHPPEGAEL